MSSNSEGMLTRSSTVELRQLQEKILNEFKFDHDNSPDSSDGNLQENENKVDVSEFASMSTWNNKDIKGKSNNSNINHNIKQKHIKKVNKLQEDVPIIMEETDYNIFENNEKINNYYEWVKSLLNAIKLSLLFVVSISISVFISLPLFFKFELYSSLSFPLLSVPLRYLLSPLKCIISTKYFRSTYTMNIHDCK